MNEENLFATIREKLNTALLSDALDTLGVANQLMHESIRHGNVTAHGKVRRPREIVRGATEAQFQNAATNSLVIVGVKQAGPNQIQIVLPRTSEMTPSAWQLYETTSALDCVKVGIVAVKMGL